MFQIRAFLILARWTKKLRNRTSSCNASFFIDQKRRNQNKFQYQNAGSRVFIHRSVCNYHSHNRLPPVSLSIRLFSSHSSSVSSVTDESFNSKLSHSASRRRSLSSTSSVRSSNASYSSTSNDSNALPNKWLIRRTSADAKVAFPEWLPKRVYR